MFPYLLFNPGHKTISIGFCIIVAFFLLTALVQDHPNSASAKSIENSVNHHKEATSSIITTTAFLPITIKPFEPRILFVLTKFMNSYNYQYELFSISTNGSDMQKFFSKDEYPNWAFWSPSGSRLVYESDNKIFVVNSDGTNHQVIVEDPNHKPAGHGSWSPDGSSIAFPSMICKDPPACDSVISSGSFSLYRFDEDQVSLILMSDSPSNTPRYSTQPQWLPDGSAFIIMSPKGDIFKTNIDGSQAEKILDGIKISRFGPFKISPNGSKLAFISTEGDLNVVDLDGSNLETIHDASITGTYVHKFAWHPDNRHIAMVLYESNSNCFLCDSEIYISHILSDQEPVHITTYDPKSIITNVYWTSGGNRLVYATNANYDSWDFLYDIYIVNADGTNPINLTPDFSPHIKIFDVFP